MRGHQVHGRNRTTCPPLFIRWPRLRRRRPAGPAGNHEIGSARGGPHRRTASRRSPPRLAGLPPAGMSAGGDRAVHGPFLPGRRGAALDPAAGGLRRGRRRGDAPVRPARVLAVAPGVRGVPDQPAGDRPRLEHRLDLAGGPLRPAPLPDRHRRLLRHAAGRAGHPEPEGHGLARGRAPGRGRHHRRRGHAAVGPVPRPDPGPRPGRRRRSRLHAGPARHRPVHRRSRGAHRPRQQPRAVAEHAERLLRGHVLLRHRLPAGPGVGPVVRSRHHGLLAGLGGPGRGRHAASQPGRRPPHADVRPVRAGPGDHVPGAGPAQPAGLRPGPDVHGRR